MTAIGILGIAFSSNRERYDSWHVPPEVKNYIESVNPRKVPHGYVDGGKFFKVDTTKSGCKVTAAAEVVLPNGEKRPFSYWLVQSNPQDDAEERHERTLEVFRGEYGIVGLYFGVKRLPIHWPGFDIKAFDHFVHIMMAHAPSWEPPHPQPWGRRT